jgi:prepilin-type N-terminal cleavage/methylation domain-containing protein/prepilin-type processing-associated H-X9-DG protein
MKRSGFTLIELLVVIAIIAILAAILFPVFARARSKAQQAQCISNLKQIIMAFKMYAADYGGYYPLGQDNSYHTYTQPYLQSPTRKAPTPDNPYGQTAGSVWFCPVMSQEEQGNMTGTQPMGLAGGYSENNWYWNQPGVCSWLQANDGQIPDPSGTVAWGDGRWYSRMDVIVNAPCAVNTNPLCPPAACVGLTADPPFWPAFALDSRGWSSMSYIARHFGKANFAYLDGHVAGLDLKTLATTLITWAPPALGSPGSGGTYSSFYLDFPRRNF